MAGSLPPLNLCHCCPFPAMLLSQSFLGFIPSTHSGLCSNVTSVRISWLYQFQLVTPWSRTQSSLPPPLLYFAAGHFPPCPCPRFHLSIYLSPISLNRTLICCSQQNPQSLQQCLAHSWHSANICGAGVTDPFTKVLAHMSPLQRHPPTPTHYYLK